MKLTSRARHAVTAMADLAAFGGGEPVSLRDIAERQRLSVSFLEQIFGRLRRGGLVESQRGAGGGYSLVHDPEATSVADIVRVMDEEIRTVACQPGSSLGCSGTSARCLTHKLWFELDQVIEDHLSGVTLATLAANAKTTEAANV